MLTADLEHAGPGLVDDGGAEAAAPAPAPEQDRRAEVDEGARQLVHVVQHDRVAEDENRPEHHARGKAEADAKDDAGVLRERALVAGARAQQREEAAETAPPTGREDGS